MTDNTIAAPALGDQGLIIQFDQTALIQRIGELSGIIAKQQLLCQAYESVLRKKFGEEAAKEAAKEAEDADADTDDKAPEEKELLKSNPN